MLAYYSAPVNIRQTALTSAGATVWAIRSAIAATVVVHIKQIDLILGFDSSTPAMRGTFRYDFVRFSTATPTGGTAISVAQMYSGTTGTQIADARFLDTGLITTGVVFNPPFLTVGCPTTDATAVFYQRNNIPVLLGPGEGLCIRLNVLATIGQSLTGEIIWAERG